MRRVIMIVAALLFAGQALAREVVNINRNWRFFSNIERRTSDGAQTVNLPHTWNNDALSGKEDYFRGLGNYMKDIAVPQAWQNKRVFIRFGGAGTVANLFINGRHVGEHRGGYTAFTFEITNFLKYGESNTFWVIVNNSSQLDVLPTAGDINIYGGLYRDVELIVADASMISVRDNGSDGVCLVQRAVSQEKAEVDAKVKIDGLPDRTLTVNLAVTTPRQDTVLRRSVRYKVPGSGQGTVVIPFDIERPILWDGMENPYLYDVKVEVADGDVSSDRITIPMGLRYFSVDPRQGFMLNGRPYRIHGVISYEDRAGAGNAVTGYQMKEDLDIIAEMGANAIRTAAYPHNRTFYEECDRRGFLVWCDLPFIGPAYMTDMAYIDTPGFKANGRQQLTEMIRQRCNNASIFAWGIFSRLNERGDSPVQYVRDLNRLAREEDPTRMTVATSNADGPINFVTDLVVWDHGFGWIEGQPSDVRLWGDNLRANWSNLRSGISYGAGASIYHQSDSLYRPSFMGNWHPERWQTHLHEQYFSYVDTTPWLWGWFVRNMFDYGAAARTWGEGTGTEDSGLVTFDRKYRKDAYYFYKANWNRSDPFVYIAERRWDKRSQGGQKIRVYSNQSEVELFVNGMSQGTRTGVNATFEWDNVPLREGSNSVEARAAGSTDNINIDIAVDVLNHKIN